MDKKILLVGNPNVGKSSLFNLLTGLHQHTGNYEGVTVAKKVGRYTDLQIVDLPGLKSLWSNNIDERISVEAILKAKRSGVPILFVASGSRLEEELLLFSQIADLQIPILLAINFKDELEKNNIVLDLDQISSRLNCPVVLLNSRTGEGMEGLKKLLSENDFRVPSAFALSHYDEHKNGNFYNT